MKKQTRNNLIVLCSEKGAQVRHLLLRKGLHDGSECLWVLRVHVEQTLGDALLDRRGQDLALHQRAHKAVNQLSVSPRTTAHGIDELHAHLPPVLVHVHQRLVHRLRLADVAGRRQALQHVHEQVLLG